MEMSTRPTTNMAGPRGIFPAANTINELNSFWIKKRLIQ